MSSSTKPILITGATGKQGGSVLRKLATDPSSSQFTLLAITRNTSSPAAQKIIEKYPDVLLVGGDLNDVPSLFKSAQDVLKANNKPEQIWGVYSVQISIGPGVTLESEVEQGTSLIDESIKQGVSHFVYSAVDRGGNEKSFDTPTPIPHFQSKYKIEKHLLEKAGKKGENMGWTILRPVAFMDNLEPGIPTKVFLAALRDTIPADKPLQWISIDDIGIFAAKAFLNPSEWNARAEGLAGDELTFEELNGCFQRATGYPAPATFGLLGTALKWAVTEMNIMIGWFASDGYAVDVKRLKGMESELCGMEKWLKERSGWAKK